MRIVLLNSLFPPVGIGGAEESTFHLAAGLKALGHDVIVIGENVDDVWIEEAVSGIPVIRLPSPPGQGPNVFDHTHYHRHVERSFRPPVGTLAERVLAEVERLSPHIIHTSVLGQLSAVWNAADAAGFCIVHTLRNYNLLCHRRMLQGTRPCPRQCFTCRGPRLKSRLAGNLLDAVVGISPHVLQVHVEAGWFGAVQHRAVIANGYDRDHPTDPVTARSDEGRPFDVGFIGRLHPTKGIEELLSAVATLRRSGIRLRLLVAGSGNPEYEAYLKGLDPDGDTVFAGFLDKVEFFRQVRFCVVPSVWFEPFGRVFVEALHHGVPVIGSNRCGGVDILTPGLNGLVTEPTVEGLEHAIRAAMALPDDAVAAMRRGALDKAPLFSSQAIAARYVDVYRKALVG